MFGDTAVKVTIRPWPSGRGFEADIQVQCIDGSKIRKRVKSPVPSRSGSQRWAEAVARELMVKGAAKPAPAKEVPTFAEFVPEFLGYCETRNKPSEIATKRKIIRALLPTFGPMRLDAIDARAIDRFKVAHHKRVSEKTGRPLSAKTVNEFVRVLLRALTLAKKWGLVSSLPEVERLRTEPQPFDFLDFAEADAFMAACREHCPEWEPCMLTALRTGMRAGELLALDWSQVDLVGRTIRVDRAFTPEGGIASPKSNRVREIPIAPDLHAVLVTHRERGSSGLVFARNGAMRNHESLGYRVARIAELAGLRRMTPHQLRHTFASHCTMRGVPARLIQQWMGHATPTMTARYSHLAVGFGHEQIEKLSPRPGLRVVTGEMLETPPARKRKSSQNAS